MITAPLPAALPKKPFNIPSLDGFRAISIIIVFLSHAGLHRIVPGLFGVTVFFFLSGYLITSLLRLEHENTGGLCLRDFYWRRVLRIFPPFYLVLGAILLLGSLGLLDGGVSGGAVAAQALFLSNYHEIFSSCEPLQGTEVFWSLAVEEHFYLIFPFVYLLLRRWFPEPRHQFYALAVLAAGVLAWRITLVYGLDAITFDSKLNYYPRICHATDTRLDGILFGSMLAVYGNPAMDQSRLGRGAWIWIGVPLSVIALLASFTIRDAGFRETFRYTLQGAALFPIFIAAIRYSDHWMFRPLNWRCVGFLGALSYSVYLTHFAVIALIQKAMPGDSVVLQLMQGVAAFAVTISLSILIHRFIELPCARLRKRFSKIERTPEVRKTVGALESPIPASASAVSPL